MPFYEYECFTCKDENNNNKRFKISKPIYLDKSNNVFSDLSTGTCPECKQDSNCRIFAPITFSQGLTLSDKDFGASKDRVDKTKWLRSERSKRKQKAEPGTKDYISNELWTGSEDKRGIIKAP